MHEFSTTDGFVEIADSLADMIKFVANEPSVGLFYIQQHVCNAVPNLINLKSKVVEKAHETTLHTEDLEDSILMARSMKECGFPIADGMIKDIRHSLSIVSARQEKKGLMNFRSSSFRLGRTTSWGRTSSPKRDVERSGYLSNMFRSARENPSSIKWPQLESRELKPAKADEPSFSFQTKTPSVADASSSSTVADADSDDLPVSSPIADDGLELLVDRSLSRDPRILSSKNYDQLNSEARLEHWLEGTANSSAD